MENTKRWTILFYLILASLPLTSTVFALPPSINPPGEKVIVVDPVAHVFGAYSADGRLLHSGVACSGANWCKDMHSPCHTRTGSFRIRNLGGGAM